MRRVVLARTKARELAGPKFCCKELYKSASAALLSKINCLHLERLSSCVIQDSTSIVLIHQGDKHP